MKVNLRKNPVDILDALVEKNVKHYKSDWYKYDRERAEKASIYYVVLRVSGSNICLIDKANISYWNIVYNKQAIDSKIGRLCYKVVGSVVENIPLFEFQQTIFSALLRLPGEYIAQESTKTLKNKPETLAEWEAKQA